jgi:Protein of unknown function (DUF3047)
VEGVRAIVERINASAGGFLRTLRLKDCLVVLTLAGLAHTSQLAVIVFNPESWIAGRTPPEWHVKVNHGRADIDSCSDGAARCVRLKSADSSFGLERAVDVDTRATPYLMWRWKVTQLPAGGDFRRAATDDQAAQLLVAFADRHVLSYIWDSTAPQGAAESAGAHFLIHVYAIVCESGAAQTGKWLPEARNVVADYEKAYGKPAPRVKGLRLQINSQHTGSVAESYFGEVVFRSKLP